MAWIWYACAIVCGTGGLALMGWSLFGDRSRGRLRCPRCWYQIGPAVEAYPVTCPECGRTIARAKLLHRTRRRWRWTAVALLIAVVGGGLAVTPTLQRDGWAKYAPTTVLILAYRYAQPPKDPIIIHLESHFQKNDWDQIESTNLRPWQNALLARQCAAVLSDDEASVAQRNHALSLLPALGPRAVAALDPLVAIIEEDRKDELWDAVNAIRSFAPAGERAIPALTALAVRADSTGAYYTDTVIEALGDYGPAAEEAVPPLVVLLNNVPKGHFGGGASLKVVIQTLGRIGPGAAPSLRRLVQLAPDVLPHLRADCIEAVGAIDPLDAPCRPLIMAGLLDAEVRIRDVSAAITVRHEPLLTSTLDVLIEGLNAEDPQERLRAARALLSLGSAAAPARSQLETATRDGDRAIRLFAIEALAAIAKSESKDSLVLESLTQDHDPVVARAARRVLR